MRTFAYLAAPGGAWLFAAACSAASAATPSSYAAVDRQSDAACRKASGFRDPVAGPPVRFSDRFLVDARLVKGIFPQAHMKGARGTMLCLYNRRTKRAEVQEANMEPLLPATAAVKDIMWMGESINGSAPVPGSRFSLMFDSGGKVGGRSGCNNYSASYMLDGSSLKVYPQMIGTRMACPPPVMAQEQVFQTILTGATSAVAGPDGRLVITGPDGQTLTFVRE